MFILLYCNFFFLAYFYLAICFSLIAVDDEMDAEADPDPDALYYEGSEYGIDEYHEWELYENAITEIIEYAHSAFDFPIDFEASSWLIDFNENLNEYCYEQNIFQIKIATNEEIYKKKNKFFFYRKSY